MNVWFTIQLGFVKFGTAVGVFRAKALGWIGIRWCYVKICSPDSSSCVLKAGYISSNGKIIIVLKFVNDGVTETSPARYTFPVRKLDASAFFSFRSLVPILC